MMADRNELPRQDHKGVVITGASFGLLVLLFLAEIIPLAIDKRLLIALLAVSLIGAAIGFKLIVDAGNNAALIRDLDESNRRIRDVELEKRKEQLNALQSQINPHFLYNTLDTIRGMAIERDCEDVSDVVAALSSMFKYNMDFSSSLVNIQSEIEQIRRFMDIQEQRFPGKYQFEEIFECSNDDLLQTLIPKFTLQPLVENAVSHGLKSRREGGILTMRYINTGHSFVIVVSDNGVGMNDETVRSLNEMFVDPHARNEEGYHASDVGIALPNVAARLRMYLGEEGDLHIDSTPEIGTDVTITLPLKRKDETGTDTL